MTDELTVVLCPSYHGATLLALLLNNHSRVSHLGDTLPGRDTLWHVCACGQRIDKCEFWTSLAEDLDAGRFVNESSLLPLTPRLLAGRTMNTAANRLSAGASLALGAWAWQWRPSAARSFAETMSRFGAWVCARQGTTMFVDGTKSITRFLALYALLKPSRARVIHLTRDPRAFLASYRKYFDVPPSPVRIGRMWTSYHQSVRLLVKDRTGIDYLCVRHEDLCASPEYEVQRMLRFLALAPEDLIQAPRWPEKHHLLGNAMVFSFDGHIRADTRWRDDVSADAQTEVMSVAGAVAKRYGYT